MHFTCRFLLIIVLSLFLSMNLVIDAESTSKKIPVQFLSINDLHGHFNTYKTAPNNRLIGGMDSLAYHFEQEKTTFAKKNKLKSAKSHSFMLQAGDLVGSSPAYSDLLQDQPVIDLMNAMNFSVGVLGNHEFDEGISEYQRLLKGRAPIKYVTQNYEFAQKYAYSPAKMTVLAANIVNKKTNKPLSGFNPYVIKQVDSIKIGFIGITTARLQKLVSAEHMKNIDVVDPSTTLAKYTKELRKKGVNAIVVIAHASIYINQDANSSIDTQGQSRLTGEVINMLKKVNKLDSQNSIDIVLAGHNHAYTNSTYKKTRLIQAYKHAEAYGVVTGTLNSKTKDFVKTPTAKIKYNYTQTEETINSNSVSKKVNTIIKKTQSVIENK